MSDVIYDFEMPVTNRVILIGIIVGITQCRNGQFLYKLKTPVTDCEINDSFCECGYHPSGVYLVLSNTDSCSLYDLVDVEGEFIVMTRNTLYEDACSSCNEYLFVVKVGLIKQSAFNYGSFSSKIRRGSALIYFGHCSIRPRKSRGKLDGFKFLYFVSETKHVIPLFRMVYIPKDTTTLELPEKPLLMEQMTGSLTMQKCSKTIKCSKCGNFCLINRYRPLCKITSMSPIITESDMNI